MKKMLCLATAGLMTLTLTGCPQPTATKKITTEDVRRETKEAAQTGKEFLAQKKAEYQKELDKKLDEMNVELKKWQEKAEKASGDAKAEMEKQVKDLQAQRDALAAKAKDFANDTGEAWEEVKKGLEKSWTELKEAFDKASDKYK
jgi:Skp family chaperone for outer membrane proteins